MKRLLALFLVAVCGSTEATDRPNLILFYTDDHGHADLGIHGVMKDVKTPHLDALARSGVVATHGYSTAPQCVPSRGGLMIGRFQGRFNLDSNGSTLEGFNKETTIATRLQNAGYATAQFGKWHLGPPSEITRHGFKHVFSQHGAQKFAANITLDGTDRPMSDLPATEYHLDGCSRAAAAIIERYGRADRDRLAKSSQTREAETTGQAQPFFLYVAYRGPHTPLDAPKRYLDRFPGEMPERRRAALAMLAAIDDGVGLILNTLEKHGLTNKTLIFFIGDNGAPLKIQKVDSPLQGDPGGWDGSLNTPLNGEKGMLAEGGISTPFLIAWPGTIPGGQVLEHPVTALDFAATACAVASISHPSALDGVNLLPHLTGENPAPPHETLYWRWGAQSAVREGNWKLLRGGEREYLYDLRADRAEKHNLASQHSDIATRLRAKLQTWASELNPPGMALGPMAAAWNAYFDHYLEGKTVAPQGQSSRLSGSETDGWEARNGKLTAKEGSFILTQDNPDKPAFITKAKLKIAGPAVAKLAFKSAETGDAVLAWRLDGDTDFLPTRRLSFPMKASSDWQTHTLQIPATGRIVHVRLHLTVAAAEFRSIELNSAKH